MSDACEHWFLRVGRFGTGTSRGEPYHCLRCGIDTGCEIGWDYPNFFVRGLWVTREDYEVHLKALNSRLGRLLYE